MPPLRRAQWKKKFFPYLLMSPTLLLVLYFFNYPFGLCVLLQPIPMRLYAILQIHGAAKLCRRLNGPGYPGVYRKILFCLYAESGFSTGIRCAFSALDSYADKGSGLYLTAACADPLGYLYDCSQSMLWKWIFQDDTGLLNYLLSLFGVGNVGFLTDKTIAIYTLVFVMTWRVIGYVMIQVLAGLKAIPVEYEEAAKIDGANKWQMFWRVRFPLLKTPMALSAIIVGLSNLNNLNVPLTLLAGGPGTSTMVVAIEIYRMSFTSYHFGESSALSIVLCLVNFLLTIFYMKAVKYEI